MARERNPARDQAKEIWAAHAGEITNREIAAQVGVDERVVAVWKQRDRWVTDSPVVQHQKRCTTKRDKKLIKAVAANDELSEQEKAFCLAWVKNFNAAAAARAAGYNISSAKQMGWELLQRPRVKKEVERLKRMRNVMMMADIDDLIDLHMRIAFADITEYVEFGRAEVPVMGAFGPVEVTDEVTGDKVTLMKVVNDVRFRESVEVDGQLISKVKQGKDGASVELADRQKSLAFLERYFSANPLDRHKIAYDNARLELERKRAGEQDTDEAVTIVDDM